MWELSAPIRRRADRKNELMPPDALELWFADKFGDDVEDDYLINFGIMIRNIEIWISENATYHLLVRTFSCSLIWITLELKNKELWINFVATRPCAQGWGFYRYLLWKLRGCIVDNNLRAICLNNVKTFNAEILRRLGFREEGESDKLSFWLPVTAARRVRREDWTRLKFPGAERLNREEDVNGSREI